MISLQIRNNFNQLSFDLTCNHKPPILFNTYKGSFSKDFMDKIMDQHNVTLFNTFDHHMFKAYIEGNGSVFQPLSNGIRVFVGRHIEAKGENLEVPFAEAIYKSLERYLIGVTAEKPRGYIKFNIESESIPLNIINVAFGVKGTSNYLVCFSINQALSTYFLKKMVAEDGFHQDLHELIVDTIAEICNTIVGNAFTAFEDSQGQMKLGTPMIFRFAKDENLVSNHPITMAEMQFNDMNVKAVVIYLDEVDHG
jgi:CheY-specific phosphatase CheX